MNERHRGLTAISSRLLKVAREEGVFHLVVVPFRRSCSDEQELDGRLFYRMDGS
jgi:hypothetical protein